MPRTTCLYIPSNDFMYTKVFTSYEVSLPLEGDPLPHVVFGTAQHGIVYGVEGYPVIVEPVNPEGAKTGSDGTTPVRGMPYRHASYIVAQLPRIEVAHQPTAKKPSTFIEYLISERLNATGEK